MATTQDGKDLGDTNFPSNEHYLREGLDVIDIGSADSPLSPLVKLCLNPIHIDDYMYKLCSILYIFLLKFHALLKFGKIQHIGKIPT